MDSDKINSINIIRDFLEKQEYDHMIGFYGNTPEYLMFKLDYIGIMKSEYENLKEFYRSLKDISEGPSRKHFDAHENLIVCQSNFKYSYKDALKELNQIYKKENNMNIKKLKKQIINLIDNHDKDEKKCCCENNAKMSFKSYVNSIKYILDDRPSLKYLSTIRNPIRDYTGDIIYAVYGDDIKEIKSIIESMKNNLNLKRDDLNRLEEILPNLSEHGSFDNNIEYVYLVEEENMKNVYNLLSDILYK